MEHNKQKKRDKIAVFGSLNFDNSYYLDQFPKPGETIFAEKVKTSFGGKGGNQALALAKLGVEIVFIGAIGDNLKSEKLLLNLENNNVTTKFIQKIKNAETGNATIFINKASENIIIVNPGANLKYQLLNLDEYIKIWNQCQFFVSQLAIDHHLTKSLFKSAQDHGIKTILNPAPIKKALSDEIIKLSSYIIANEEETKKLLKLTSFSKAERAQHLAKFSLQYPNTQLIVTLGKDGVIYWHQQKLFLQPARKVVAIDTTAAGDTFIGAFVYSLWKQKNLHESIKFANLAASLTVQKRGAYESIPTLEMILKEL